ncbi:MAG: hypothetical protein HY761_06755 [Candidatus Omnitrophica bacterium]|nr:hypothetical protein [Candidatus Omnitrophota bacterium]
MNKKKSQSILDFVFTFVGILILVIGIARVMVWFNANYAARDVIYQKTRLQAGTPAVQEQKTDLVSVVPFRPLELTEEWVFKGEPGQQVDAWSKGLFEGGGFSPSECLEQCNNDQACFDKDGKFNKECPCYTRCICLSRVQPMVNALTNQVKQYCGQNEDCGKIGGNRCGDGMACNFWRNANSMWDKASQCDDPWEICWWGNWGKTASELKKAAHKLWDLASKFETEGAKLKQKRDGMVGCCSQATFADQQRCFCNVKEDNPQKQLECRCSSYRSVEEQAQCMCSHIVDQGLRQACEDSINKRIYSITPFEPGEDCKQSCLGKEGCGLTVNTFNVNCGCFGQCVCGAQSSAAFDGAISTYCGSDLNCNKVQLNNDCKTCANSPVSCKTCFSGFEAGCNAAACNAYIVSCQRCGALAAGNRAKCLNCAAENSGMACDFCNDGRQDENFTEAQCAIPWRANHPKQNCKEVGGGRYQWCKIWIEDPWFGFRWCFAALGASPIFNSEAQCHQWCDWQWLYQPCPPGDPFFVGADYMLGYLLSYRSANIIEEAGKKVVNQKEEYRKCCLKPTQAERAACIQALTPIAQ